MAIRDRLKSLLRVPPAPPSPARVPPPAPRAPSAAGPSTPGVRVDLDAAGWAALPSTGRVVVRSASGWEAAAAAELLAARGVDAAWEAAS